MKDTIYREDALFCLTADITNISLEDYIAMIDKRISELPSAEPKTGEWIKTMEGNAYRDKCNRCLKTYPNAYGYNFCPNCGSYNGGMT